MRSGGPVPADRAHRPSAQKLSTHPTHHPFPPSRTRKPSVLAEHRHGARIAASVLCSPPHGGRLSSTAWPTGPPSHSAPSLARTAHPAFCLSLCCSSLITQPLDCRLRLRAARPPFSYRHPPTHPLFGADARPANADGVAVRPSPASGPPPSSGARVQAGPAAAPSCGFQAPTSAWSQSPENRPQTSRFCGFWGTADRALHPEPTHAPRVCPWPGRLDGRPAAAPSSVHPHHPAAPTPEASRKRPGPDSARSTSSTTLRAPPGIARLPAPAEPPPRPKPRVGRPSSLAVRRQLTQSRNRSASVTEEKEGSSGPRGLGS
ncbi:hypothetical protein PtA15_4A755 [Puccinia triticina]|uniref:Uncharacterized protein n=1 Tax=Puccinia triticina TaxID=208348 RepID=A0ABY7CK06_9BASI|nr:uncharacterized protein PtA15_4A755 [Puccinia triticina]WAQ84302.1 hypothetical protein PtA15_4A755 [Puccinia triticina]